MTRDPLAPFEERVLAAVARDYETSTETLRGLVQRHQELVRRLPGVDDVVYEWRRGVPDDPVVVRRPDVYYLSVAAHVWPEYVEALALDDEEAAALRAVHRRQLESSVGGRLAGERTRQAMVLTRE
jgi:hypothetical protein